MPQLQAAPAATLATWHHMVAIEDFSALPSIVDPAAEFRSPMAHAPYKSAAAVVLVLRTVIEVFENFTYHRQLFSEDGYSVVLEFSANVGDRQLRGVDLIRFGEDGKIVEFEVMVRPMSALAALGAEMGKRLGHLLPAYKSQAT